MVGRGALADPWIFREAAGGPAATREEAVHFALRYFDLLLPPGGPSGALARFKAFLAPFRAGGLFEGGDDTRRRLLRERDPAPIRAWFEAEASTRA
jgi:tRNA-dihydrouridine synthase